MDICSEILAETYKKHKQVGGVKMGVILMRPMRVFCLDSNPNQEKNSLSKCWASLCNLGKHVNRV